MREDGRGVTNFVTAKPGLRCISCKREIAVGETRYPVWTSENYNRCTECYYSITETKPQKITKKVYQT